MADLTFWTNPMSRGRTVRWALEEVRAATGLDYETVLLDFATTAKAPEYLAVNPMGKVPAIRHGDVVVTEAAAICAYLGDAFPDAGLAPPVDAPERGPYYRWLFFATGPIEAAVTATAMRFDVPVEREGTVGWGSLTRVLDTLEGAVAGGGWLAGDRFTMADLYVGASLGWGMMFGAIPKRPAFEDYTGRALSRPAAVRAREIDDALMPKETAE